MHQIARLEHEQRARSLASVSEFGDPGQAKRRRWLLRQVGHLLYALGYRLALLGERMKHGRDIAFHRQRGTNYEMDYS